jgi:TetR/AcrR family transcriptional regulator
VPKETFYNLSEKKKNKILDAAIQEFSTHRFSEASINQIVKTAEISRGSFYQYFDTKEDLYLYVLTEIGKKKMEVATHTRELRPEADFFETYIYMMENILAWAKENPVYYQIGMLMDIDDSEFITNLKAKFPEGLKPLRDSIEFDKQRGLIKKDVDTELLLDLVYTVQTSFIKEYYSTGSDKGFIKKAREVLNIIKGGIQVVQGKES